MGPLVERRRGGFPGFWKIRGVKRPWTVATNQGGLQAGRRGAVDPGTGGMYPGCGKTAGKTGKEKHKTKPVKYLEIQLNYITVILLAQERSVLQPSDICNH